MRKLLAALSRTFYRPRSSTHRAGVLQLMSDTELDKWNFTFMRGTIPPEDPVVAGMTFNAEWAENPEWVASFYRTYKLCFADAAEPEPPNPNTE